MSEDKPDTAQAFFEVGSWMFVACVLWPLIFLWLVVTPVLWLVLTVGNYIGVDLSHANLRGANLTDNLFWQTIMPDGKIAGNYP